MTEIRYSEFDSHLTAPGPGGFGSLYLIHGEEMLCKAVLEKLVEALLPDGKRSLGYEPLDGTGTPVSEALERVNTYGLLAGSKVVALLDSSLFPSGRRSDDGLEKAQKAAERGELKTAARHLMAAMSAGGLKLDDLSEARSRESLKLPAVGQGDDWVERVVEYCRENSLEVSPAGAGLEQLQRALEKGFPRTHHLLITTEQIDRRRREYKFLEKKGVVIDCSVPKGERRADRMAQTAVLDEQAQALLAAAGKTIERDAFQSLQEMTGFDLRTFNANLEKLIVYTGRRPRINAADVTAVLERTRQDPIFELTGAVAARDFLRAVQLTDRLLEAQVHPLQILAAIANQVRRLLVAKDFLDSPAGRSWHAGCSYDEFRQRVLPHAAEYDQRLAGVLSDWRQKLDHSADRKKGPGKGRKSPRPPAIPPELTAARNPRNPYPTYMAFKSAGGHRPTRLKAAFAELHRVDRRLKSGGQDPRPILETVLRFICEPG